MARIDDKTLSLTPGKRIELYTVDLAIANGPILRFTPNREDLTPAVVTRIGDTNTGVSGRTSVDLTPYFSNGDTILISGYIRKGEGGAHFPVISLANTSAGSTLFARMLMNLDTLADSPVNSSPITSGNTCTLTMASEFVFFSCQAVVVDSTALWLGIWPAYGTPYPTQLASALGTVDVFGLRVFNRRGGLNIPVVLPPISTWVRQGAGVTVTDVANTAMAVKVPVWQGNTYTPLPITATGFEKSGNGPFPKPKLSMSNLTGTGSLLVQQYGDIRGSGVTRTRLYADHLDNGIDPDPAAFYNPDVFVIARRSFQDAQTIEFELASKLDQQGVSLPRRQLLRDVCPFKYRVWNPALNAGAGGFDYSKATCPYSGSAMFDTDGIGVAQGALDKCSQILKTGCRARYGRDVEIPFGGFPMVGRFGS